MFIGHYAVGFAAKKWAPKVSLGSLVVGAIFLDLLWPLFLMLDMEHFRVQPGITAVSPFDFYDYPLSHSLFMVLAWSLLVGLIYLAATKDERGGVVMGLLVLSHWGLDLVVHRPDLGLWPVEMSNMVMTKLGLGLWSSFPGTLIVEIGLFAAGIAYYMRTTKALDQVGEWALWGFVAFLLVAYVASLKSMPPSDSNKVSLMGFAQLLLVAWAFWIDDHRRKV